MVDVVHSYNMNRSTTGTILKNKNKIMECVKSAMPMMSTIIQKKRGKVMEEFRAKLAGNPCVSVTCQLRSVFCRCHGSSTKPHGRCVHGQNMGIGKNRDLPWPLLRNEYRYFQRMTTTSSAEGKQNLVIMGRKTWFSIHSREESTFKGQN